MNLGKILSAKNIGMLMNIVTGGTPDTAKLMALVTDMITDENVTAIVREIHVKYEQEAAKLGEGHMLSMDLQADTEKGLILRILDVFPAANGLGWDMALVKEIVLADLKAADIKAIFDNEPKPDSKTIALPAPTATTDDVVPEAEAQPDAGTVVEMPQSMLHVVTNGNGDDLPAGGSIGGKMIAPEAQPDAAVQESDELEFTPVHLVYQLYKDICIFNKNENRNHELYKELAALNDNQLLEVHNYFNFKYSQVAGEHLLEALQAEFFEPDIKMLTDEIINRLQIITTPAAQPDAPLQEYDTITEKTADNGADN